MNREWGGCFFISLINTGTCRVKTSVKSTYSFHFHSTTCMSFRARINSLWPTNLTTEKGFHFSLSATSRIMVLSGFPLSDSVERECSSASPWYFPGFLKTYEQRQKWMVSSVSSHRLCHKATLVLYVQRSGNTRKGFFACFSITNHHISAAAKENKKWGGWAENKMFLPPTPPPLRISNQM